MSLDVEEARHLQEGDGPESDAYWARAGRGQSERYKKLLLAARERIRMVSRAKTAVGRDGAKS